MSVIRYGIQLLGLSMLAAVAVATVVGSMQYRRRQQEAARRQAEREADEITYADVVKAFEVIHVWLATKDMADEWAAMNGEGE